MKRSKMLSNRITDTIATQLPYKTVDELEVINYGIEAFIMNIYKFAIISAIAYYFNVFDLLIITLCSYGIIRFFASGIHASNWYVCLLTSAITMLGIVFISISTYTTTGFKTIILILSVIAFAKYAPADTEERPLVNAKKRKFQKLGSIVVAFGLYLFSIITPDSVIGNISIYSILVAALFILPITYKLYGKKYDNYKNYLNT